MPKLALAATILALLAVPATAAAASTYTVTSGGDGAGTCTGTVCQTLRAAVTQADANAGSTIQLGSIAQFTLTQGVLQLSANMTIAGAGAASTTIDQTTVNAGVVAVSAATSVTLSGLTITGGNKTGSAGTTGATGGAGGSVQGAGVYNAGTLTLDHVAVAANTLTAGAGGTGTSGSGGLGGYAQGAGIDNEFQLTLTDSTVTGNVATSGAGGTSSSGHVGPAGGGADGGGIFNEGQMSISGSSISNNTATSGHGGNAPAAGSGGTAAEAIGGIDTSQNSSTSTTILDSTIAGNSATTGNGGTGNGMNHPGGYGGLTATGGLADTGTATLAITGSTISDNTATGGAGGQGTGGANGGPGGESSGGGIDVDTFSGSRAILIVSSTISGNSATGGIGGVASGGGATASAGGAAGGGLVLAGSGSSTLLNDTVVNNSAAAGVSSGPTTTYQTTGGGIESSSTLRLASTTISGNFVSADALASGGNLVNGGTTAMSDTILTGGVDEVGSSVTQDNCVGTVTDDGFNLEATSPSQCGLSAGQHDVIGSDPGLQALAANGSQLAQTMALSSASPARGAGGACVDPTNGNAPLTTDERGLARSTTCDIGAFQGQPVTAGAAPQITGTPAVGQTLACSQGSWGGDGPLVFTYLWLQDGSAIPGAAAATYVVGVGDAGHQLSCTVSAALYGSAQQASQAVSVPALPANLGGGSPGSTPTPTPTAPSLTALSETNRSFLAAAIATPLSGSTARATGTVFSFQLDQAASVSIVIARVSSGRLVGSTCRRSTTALAHRRACRLLVAVATLTRTAHQGVNRVRFTGRIGRTALAPASYTASFTATDSAGSSAARSLGFTIVKR